MPKEQKVGYSQLEVGYQFPPSSYKLDSSIVATYLKAIEETGSLYQDSELVPPMAVAAYAMAVLSESISLPPGTIHVSQEFEFIDTVTTKDTVTSYATVNRRQDRGRLHLLTVDLNVFNQDRQKIAAGKTGFVLPEQDDRP